MPPSSINGSTCSARYACFSSGVIACNFSYSAAPRLPSSYKPSPANAAIPTPERPAANLGPIPKVNAFLSNGFLVIASALLTKPGVAASSASKRQN